MTELLPIEAVDPSRMICLPAVGERRRAEVSDELQRVRDQLSELGALVPCPERGCEEVDHFCGSVDLTVASIAVVEECLASNPTEIDPVLAAEFALFAAIPGIAVNMAVQIAFGEEAGWMEVHELSRLSSRAGRRGLSLDDYIADLARRGEVPHGPATRTLHGETRRPPDAERVRRGIALLRHLAALVPDSSTAVCLSIIGWLQWARGKHAVALAYLAEAQLVGPMGQAVYGLTWLVTTKRPRWVRDDLRTPRDRQA